MATVPAIPSFTKGETPSIAKLNQLAAVVAYATQMPIVCSLKSRGKTTSVPASSNTAVQWGTVECDTDGMFNSASPTVVTVKTPGYYRFQCCVAAAISDNEMYEVHANQIFGSNNPNGAAGSTHFITQAGCGSSAVTGDYQSLSIGGLTPYMYAGDQLQVLILCTAATTVNNSFMSTGASGQDIAGNYDGATAFQMYWVSEGP